MKSYAYLLFLGITICSCKKETPNPVVSTGEYSYASVSEFYQINGVKSHVYNINAVAGGTFVSPKGTTVTIPANAFVDNTNTSITGNVQVEFKDIYKKSDMVLSDRATNRDYGFPLKSGGEFFIKAVQNNIGLSLGVGKEIVVNQPAVITGSVDPGMLPFRGKDTASSSIKWVYEWNDSLYINAEKYVYSIYSLSTPPSKGKWCNSDNPDFFAGCQLTQASFIATDSVYLYTTQVFLIFTGISSAIHVYSNSYNGFTYNWAPNGYQCTVVAFGVLDGQLYSAFVPTTISNIPVSFTLQKTTTAEFVSQLRALD